MGSIPNWATTSATTKRTLRSRVVQFPARLERAYAAKRKVEMLFTQGSNVATYRSTSWTGTCLTSLSRREAVLPLRQHHFLPSGSR